MTAFVTGRWGRLGWRLRLVLVAISLPHAALAADPVNVSAAGEAVTVHIDQAKVLKLPEHTATLVIGNPLIADVTVQAGGILVVTAKSYGVTNVIALNRSGAVLMEHPIQVLMPNDNIVVVHRGVERESYSCVPDCQRRIMLGDTAAYFTANLGQTDILNKQAQGQSTQQK